MAMSVVWVFLLTLSVLCGALGGTAAAVGAAALTGAQRGAEVALSLAGALCLWSALARVMRAGGLSDALTRLLHPLLRRLFPQAARDPEAAAAISGNLAANLLGLGNAATPLGIAAVRRMQLLSKTDTASDEMCRLIVLNTASIQLIPATVAGLRAGLGAARPFSILPAVWCVSALSVSAGLLAASVLRRWWRA